MMSKNFSLDNLLMIPPILGRSGGYAPKNIDTDNNIPTPQGEIMIRNFLAFYLQLLDSISKTLQR